ncbi:MAG: cystathionine beta-lyase [Ponticaulis sp.]|nr:cystathionine beta-lyase [Ponticaulis sp.]
MSSDQDTSKTTRMVHAGRSADRFGGSVNPPIQRASTLLSPDAEGLYSGPKSLYGRMGMTVQDVLIEGLKELEGAEYGQLSSNGLSACSMALASAVQAGDNILMTDSAYGPTRRFAERYLGRMGVTVSFFHPRITGRDFEVMISENTKAVFFEMPGSLTFELHDLSALLPICKARHLITILDNTWSAGLFLQPLSLGIDLSLQALTKYVVGHSDSFGGAVLTRSKKLSVQLEAIAQDWGISLAPDDAYAAQRGLRTLPVRLKQQEQTALELARWLETHPKVRKVYHPALPSHEDHEIWNKLFSGSSGLFSFTLHETDTDKLKPFYDSISLFGFGFSYGGFESLMIPCDPQLKRTISTEWANRQRGSLVRISVGLEDPADLRADLANALDQIDSSGQ